MTAGSTSEHDRKTSTVTTHRKSEFPPRQHVDVSMKSSSSSPRPQLLPVPVARNSFRIDDILGEDKFRRGEASAGLSTVKDSRQSSTFTEQNSARDLVGRPRPDDVGQRFRRGSEMYEEVGRVEEVERKQRRSSPVTRRPRDSTIAAQMSVGQFINSSPPSPRQRPPAGVDGATRLRHSDQYMSLSPTSLSPCLIQHHQRYAEVAEPATAAVFEPRHPLFGVALAPSSSTFPLHTLFVGRHDTFIPGREFYAYHINSNLFFVRNYSIQYDTIR